MTEPHFRRVMERFAEQERGGGGASEGEGEAKSRAAAGPRTVPGRGRMRFSLCADAIPDTVAEEDEAAVEAEVEAAADEQLIDEVARLRVENAELRRTLARNVAEPTSGPVKAGVRSEGCNSEL